MVSADCDMNLFSDKLSTILQESGKDLQEKVDHRGKSIGAFRNIQRLLLDCEDSTQHDAHIRFLVFFLKTFIEKVFYNFNLDIVLGEGGAEEIYFSFCRTVGKALFKLGENLQERRYPEFYSCYVQMGVAYLDSVYYFNKLTGVS
jgi:hypothetical protein